MRGAPQVTTAWAPNNYHRDPGSNAFAAAERANSPGYGGRAVFDPAGAPGRAPTIRREAAKKPRTVKVSSPCREPSR